VPSFTAGANQGQTPSELPISNPTVNAIPPVANTINQGIPTIQPDASTPPPGTPSLSQTPLDNHAAIGDTGPAATDSAVQKPDTDSNALVIENTGDSGSTGPTDTSASTPSNVTVVNKVDYNPTAAPTSSTSTTALVSGDSAPLDNPELALSSGLVTEPSTVA
jgi:hypothetical protein